MKWKALALAFALCLFCTQITHAGPDSPWSDAALAGRIEPALLKRLMAAQPGEQVPIIVTMASPAPAAKAPTSRNALVSSLQATAAGTQQRVHTFLNEEQAAGRASEIQPFWIFNGLAVHAVPDTVRDLALRDDVQLVRLDRYENRLGGDTPATLASEIPVAQAEAPAPASTGADAAGEAPGLSWGVRQVRADQVWSALGDTGSSVVVANMDTGVDFLHPALAASYRGNLGKGMYEHDGNWFDATDNEAVYPYDGHGHGTHTMGTIAGQGGIGVAPGARWIAARVLNAAGEGYESWIHAGFQWLLAPGGDPARAPQIVNNSWGNSVAETTEFQADIAALQQAGIFVVFSAGNNGPQSATLGSPASLPGVLAIAATDQDDEVAGFSSRGPSPWGEIKPTLAAPGVGVISAFPGGIYASMNGTSMAAPHVSGIAALMLSAHPGLTVTATVYALTSTTVARSAPLPNNNTGWGRVDAYAAVQAVSGAGEIAGTAEDAYTQLPLAGVQIEFRSASGALMHIATDSDGRYRVGLTAGRYRLEASRFGYESQAVSQVTVYTGTLATQNIELVPLPVGILRGSLTESGVGRPATVTVSALGTPVGQTKTGLYELDLPAGSYTIEARGLGYRVMTTTITIAPNQITQHDFALSAIPRVLFVNSGPWYYDDQGLYFQQALGDLAFSYDERRIKNSLEDTPVITDLLKYNLVIWSSPADSPGLVGAGDAVGKYLKAGGRFLLSGQDVGYWDGGGSGLFAAPYFWQYLKTRFEEDNSGSHDVSGLPGEVTASLAFSIEGGDGADNQLYPDVLSVGDPDYAAGVFAYGGGGLAGTRVGLCLPYRGLVFGFGFEAIDSRVNRRETLRKAVDYLTGPRQPRGLGLAMTSPQVQVAPAGQVVTFTLRARNTGEAGGSVQYRAALDSAGWPAAVEPAELTLAPCTTATLTATVTIPTGARIDARNLLTVTVRGLNLPDIFAAVTMTAKTPAPVLLVDDHRWYDVQTAYTQALRDARIPYDLWEIPESGPNSNADSPSAARMAWYTGVVWFTGYDWYRPLTRYEESIIGSYLDGGGGLLLSSPFYLDNHGVNAFALNRLGVISYTFGITATQVYGSPGGPLGSDFNPVPLTDPYPRASFFTLEQALVPGPNTMTAWRGDHDRPVAVARAAPTGAGGGRLIYWGTPIEALPAGSRAAVLRRAVGWLGPFGGSTVQVSPTVARAGQPVSVQLTLRNDREAAPASLLVHLPSGFVPVAGSLPPGLVYDPGAGALFFSGTAPARSPMTFSFQLVSAGPAAGRSAGKAIFHHETLGLDFEQPLDIGFDTPDLALALSVAGPMRGGQPTTVRLAIRNDGAAPATAGNKARAVALAPLELRVITGTATLAGPGTISEGADRVTWEGPLAPGETITISYQVRPSADFPVAALPLEALAWDGEGGSWEQRTWLSFPTIYMPWIWQH